MKDYFEFKDGTFWAIYTKGTSCYTTYGSKYEDFFPERLLMAGLKKAEYYGLPPQCGEKNV